MQGRGGIGVLKTWRRPLKRYRRASCLLEQMYNVPKSIVHDHASFKVSDISRPGPKPVLTKQEEMELVLKMAEIGSGQCRQQV